MKAKYELGQELKDVVTGYTGIVLAITHYYTGCVHYSLQLRKLDENGKERPWEGYDESRLAPTGKRVTLPGLKMETSGPMPKVPKV